MYNMHLVEYMNYMALCTTCMWYTICTIWHYVLHACGILYVLYGIMYYMHVVYYMYFMALCTTCMWYTMC